MSVDVERELRGALAARAAQITPERLQPAVPPTAMPARRSASWLAGRFRWLLLAGVTMVLIAVVVANQPPDPGPDRPPPERPANSVPPSTSPSPSPPTSPSPSRPAVPAGPSAPSSSVPSSSVPASPVPASSPAAPRTAGSSPGPSASAHP